VNEKFELCPAIHGAVAESEPSMRWVSIVWCDIDLVPDAVVDEGLLEGIVAADLWREK
jgi:hypothetical protein